MATSPSFADRTGYRGPKRQRGIVLIVSLLFLLILTILAVSSMGGSTLQERMSGNNLDQAKAFEAAEAALRAGEDYVAKDVTAQKPTMDKGCANGLCTSPAFQNAANAGWQTNPNSAVWNNARSVDVTMGGIKTKAKYIVEDMCEVTPDTTPTVADSKRLFRITAMATGGTDNSRVILQSTYLADSNMYYDAATPTNCKCHGSGNNAPTVAGYCTGCGFTNCDTLNDN